jgi:hypothetical protein
VGHNPDCCKLRGLHVDLNPEVDVPFLLKPQQPDLPAKKFSAVGKSESVVEWDDFVDTIPTKKENIRFNLNKKLIFNTGSLILGLVLIFSCFI